MTRTLTSAVVLLALADLSLAQAPPVQPIVLQLHPAAEPRPVLKYHLLPWTSQQRPGNAAVHYYRASLVRESISKEAQEKFNKYVGKAVKDIPPNELTQVLRTYKNVLKEIELAARSRHCDWQMGDQIRADGVGVLLPEVQRFREFAALLQLKVRLEMSEGRADDAVATLQTGFALARHISDMPTLISALVGLAIAHIMTGELETLMQMPGAPNFYWALTELPRPFIALDRALQTERLMVDNFFPGLRELADNLRAGPLTPEQLQAFEDKICKLSADEGGIPGLGTKAGLAILTAKFYPDARKRAIARGRTAEQVAALPIFQVVLVDQLHQYNEQFDEMAKWQGLPYWQARAGMKRTEQRLKQERAKNSGPLPTLAGLLLPAMEKVFEAQTRVDRKIAALRCIEAVRLYAAAHDGKLPASLDDLDETPPPLDPVTGKVFDYQVDGNTATLYAQWPGRPAGAPNTLSYRLILTR